ncbi:MAG: DNA polymerase III subunit delta [Desulfoarculaceae bacterium]|nr:DNA polymerase III subunit delta [Desulfoarculaceae bacterium]
MTLIKRNELASWLVRGGVEQESRLVLFFGERYLCREAADMLQQALLRKSGGVVHAIDGDQEDPGRTLGQIMNFSLLPGRQIYRVTDSRLFHSRAVAKDIWNKAVQAHAAGRSGPARQQLQSLVTLAALDGDETLAGIGPDQWQQLFAFAKPASDLTWADSLLSLARPQAGARGGVAGLADRYLAAFAKGFPGQNILFLSTESVDKRKQLYTFIKKNGLVIDCSIDGGAGSAAQKEQKEVLRELALRTLALFEKKMEPRAMDMLFERVGFHPVAVVMELEKVALFALERPLITCADLETMVGRTREDALFELTESFGKRQLAATLVILGRLQENGIHGLAILATMRNYIRKMLLFRSLQLQTSPPWQRGMQARQFQDIYLPALKEKGEWAEILKGHPYALFMSFSKAAEFSCPQLKEWMALLLKAEFRIKGSPLPQTLLLEELFLSMAAEKNAEQKQQMKKPISGHQER